jgi:hypothetical protein
MPPSKLSFSAPLALVYLIFAGTQCSLAQYPTNWWPDPSTGLMWSGEMTPTKTGPPFGTRTVNGFTWQQATDYCSSLQLAGYVGWRLPTLDEVKAVTAVMPHSETSSELVSSGKDLNAPPHFADVTSSHKELLFKGGLHNDWDIDNRRYSYDPSVEYTFAMDLWTSTQSQPDLRSAWIFELLGSSKGYLTKDVTDEKVGVICVRAMEPDLLKVAKAAGEAPPVPDIQTLQNFIPLNNARLAYQAGNYQESITQAQTAAITLKASPEIAYRGIGISYGRLGQWDQAIANLQSALKVDQYYGDAVTALEWAKDGQKAAKKGKLPKEPNPTWN